MCACGSPRPALRPEPGLQPLCTPATVRVNGSTQNILLMDEASLTRIIAARASLSRSVCAAQPVVDTAMAAPSQNLLTADVPSSESYTLTVTQQPQQGKVYQRKDKGRSDRVWVARLIMADRKPLEPPPVIELSINDQDPYK